MKKQYFLLFIVAIALLFIAIFSQYFIDFTVVDVRLESPVNEEVLNEIVNFFISEAWMGPKYLFIEPKGNQDILIWFSGEYDKEQIAQGISLKNSLNCSFTIDRIEIFNESKIISSESVDNTLSLVLETGDFQLLKSAAEADNNKDLLVYHFNSKVYNTSLSSIKFNQQENKIILPIKENAQSKEFILFARFGKLMRNGSVSKVWYQKRFVLNINK
ncbi:MAG: hypothetical protein O8C61_05755 [Candidatus Methanoperedens sp.]|nr:hypothetical protein [Candidatus Methanoperedens sp.]